MPNDGNWRERIANFPVAHLWMLDTLDCTDYGFQLADGAVSGAESLNGSGVETGGDSFLYDGTNVTNLYTTTSRDTILYGADKLVLGVWFKVADASEWTTAGDRNFITVGTSGGAGNLNIYIRKDDGTNYDVRFLLAVDGNGDKIVTADMNSLGIADANWHRAVMVIDHSAKTYTAYIDGNTIGTSGAWTTAISSSLSIGSRFNAGGQSSTTNRFNGSLEAVLCTNTDDPTGLIAVYGNPNQPPTLTNPGTLTGYVDYAYSSSLSASDPDGGDSITLYEASNLPDGLAVNSGTGAFTGTPTAVGTFNNTSTVTDNALGTGTGANKLQAWETFDFEIETLITVSSPSNQTAFFTPIVSNEYNLVVSEPLNQTTFFSPTLTYETPTGIGGLGYFPSLLTIHRLRKLKRN